MSSLVSKTNEVHGQEWTVRNWKSSIPLTTMVPYMILRLWKWADWHWYHPTNHRTWFTKDYGLHNSLLINSILCHPLMEGVRHTRVHLSCFTWQAKLQKNKKHGAGIRARGKSSPRRVFTTWHWAAPSFYWSITVLLSRMRVTFLSLPPSCTRVRLC